MPICDTPIFVSLSTEIVVGGPYHARADADLWSLGEGQEFFRQMGEPTESVHVAAGNSRAMDSSSVIVIQANGKLLVGALLVQQQS